MASRREGLLALITVLVTLVLCLGTAEAVLRFLPFGVGFFPSRSRRKARSFTSGRTMTSYFRRAGTWSSPTAAVSTMRASSTIRTTALTTRHRSSPSSGLLHRSLHGAVPRDPAGAARSGARRQVSRLQLRGVGGAAQSVSGVGASCRSRLRGSALVINVVGNDSDNSLATYLKDARGFSVYVRNSTGELRLQLIKWNPGAGGRFTSRSSLAGYLVHNLQAVYHAASCGPGVGAVVVGSLVGTTALCGQYRGRAGTGPDTQIARSDRRIFSRLPRRGGASPRPRAVHDRRLPLSAGRRSWRRTYFDHMRQAFRAKAQALGYGAIDLDPAFFARHVRTGERFEYPTDDHWSPAGHGVAFEAVMNSPLIKTPVH